MTGRRIGTVAAIALGVGLVATGALAGKNPCKDECKTQKSERIMTAKTAKGACLEAAASKTEKKACKSAFRSAVRSANGDYRQLVKSCKAAPTTAVCTGSPSGAFID